MVGSTNNMGVLFKFLSQKRPTCSLKAITDGNEAKDLENMF